MSATLVHPDGWYPSSWRRRPARQLHVYADRMRSPGERVLRRPPVVDFEDAAGLRRGRGWSRAAASCAGGDCAESSTIGCREVAGIVGLVDAMAAKMTVRVALVSTVARIAGSSQSRAVRDRAHDGLSLPPIAGTSSRAGFERQAGGRSARMIARTAIGGTAGAWRRHAGRGGRSNSHEALLLPMKKL